MSVPMTIESKAIKILEEYQGANNYILNLKSKLEKNPKFFPTRSQCDYIFNNKDFWSVAIFFLETLLKIPC